MAKTYRYSIGGYEGDQLQLIVRAILNDADAHPLRRVPLRELVEALQKHLTVWDSPEAVLLSPAPPVQHRRACACAEPDPVMQADRKFYCHRCSFETGARPSALEPENTMAPPVEQERPQDGEQRLDALFNEAFGVDHPAMLDYIALKFELKRLRGLAASPVKQERQKVELEPAVCEKCGRIVFENARVHQVDVQDGVIKILHCASPTKEK